MIPAIFVSSTIVDLQHLRDAIRDTISELAYIPIMSEYGDIGFLPNLSAPESCYAATSDCQLAVLMIGKRYGDASQGGISVTHKEFRTIKTSKIPLITLIDKETWAFKRVYSANKASPPAAFPGMDNPSLTFALIQEVIDSPTNNGIITFEHVADARDNFRKQLAHIFGNYLRGNVPVVKADVKDILSEIIALRQELQPKPDDSAIINLRVIRYLVEDQAKPYRTILEKIIGPLELAVGVVAQEKSFADVMAKADASFDVIQGKIDYKPYTDQHLLIAGSESMA